MYYKIDGEDEIYTDIDSVIEHCIDPDYHWDDDYFEDWVNDYFGYIDIREARFTAYDILSNMDEYLFDELRKEYCKAEDENDEDEARYELEKAVGGDKIYIQGQIVKCFEESGDSDGDKELQDRKQISSKVIENVKAYLTEQKEQEKIYAAAEKEKEDELLKVFQVIP